MPKNELDARVNLAVRLEDIINASTNGEIALGEFVEKLKDVYELGKQYIAADLPTT